MPNNADLLRQLSIDRDAATAAPKSKWPWLVLGLLLVGGGVAAFAWQRDAAIPVKLVVAAVQGTAPRAGSVLDASGYVVARRQATVSSKVTGKVTEIDFEEGQRVQQGDVLARLDASNLGAQVDLARAQIEQARAQLAELKVSLVNAERDQRRNRDLLAKGLVPQSAVDNADTAVAQYRARIDSTEHGVRVAERQLAVTARSLDDTVVRAPFSGIITVKNAQPGEMISPLSAGGAGTRTGLGTLVDMESLEVEVDVNENFLGKVKSGQRATTKLNAYPEWEIPSRLIAIIPTADRSKATVKVRVGFDRPPGVAMDARILPEMGARVSFLGDDTPPPSAEAKPRRVVVPAEAIHDESVFVVTGDTVHRTAIKTGAVEGTQVTVLEGLSGGESLAVGDFSKLKDNGKVKIEGETK